MKVTVFRYNAETGGESLNTYELPFSFSEGRTVLSIMRYIHDNLDPTVSFYNHSACGRGICGRCLMDINGKKRLACSYVPDCDEITIKPKSDKYFKDLICK